MDPSEAPPSPDPAQSTMADPSPAQQAPPFPSEAPLSTCALSDPSSSTPSVSVPSPSSSATSHSQPQSQPLQPQRQPIAARTRSQTQLGQPPFIPPLSAPSPSSSAAPLMQRSGLTIGVPALHPHLARPSSSAGYPFGSSSHFNQPLMGSGSPSPSFSQSFSGFSRSSVPLAEQSSGSNGPSSSFSQPFSAMSRSSAGMFEAQTSNSQFKPPPPSVQTIGMIGSLSGVSRLRASGIQHQQRIGQPVDKFTPQLATNQTLTTPKFPNLGLPKPSSMPSLNTPISASQSAQSLQQQWMSSQGKHSYGTPFPSSSHRAHTKLHTSQQRPKSPQQQQHHSPPLTPTHLLPSSSQQQQQKQLTQSQQQSHLQDLHNNKNQQQPVRSRILTQRSINQHGQSEDSPDIGCQILGKRSIQELLAQIDPYEKLESDVEDVLMEIADDFVESITTAACSLAKHRKSTSLEAKDVLLHVERNWNITLPGFGGDDIKLYKKPYTNDIHKERLAMIRKSMGIASDFAGSKNTGASQIAVSTKGFVSKASSAPFFTSPKCI